MRQEGGRNHAHKVQSVADYVAELGRCQERRRVGNLRVIDCFLYGLKCEITEVDTLKGSRILL